MHDYFEVLLNYDWELTKSPAGAHQWTPTAASNAKKAPKAGDANGTQALNDDYCRYGFKNWILLTEKFLNVFIKTIKLLKMLLQKLGIN